MTPAKQCAAIEQQLRDVHQSMQELRNTLVHTRAPGAKPIIYATDLVRRALAEVASLNLGERG